MPLLTEHIDKSTPIPLYFQLKELILRAIKSGEYPVGSTIPTENELSQAFEISRTTVRQAIVELVQEGWLYREKSKGTFVMEPKINQDFIQKLEPFNIQILRSGHRPRTKQLEKKICIPPQEVAETLRLLPDEQAICIVRCRYADETPIVVVTTYLPYTRCKFVLDRDMEKESLYEVLDDQESTKVRYVHRRIEAVAASESDAEMLEFPVGAPVQFFCTVGFTALNEPVEYSLAYYRGDRSSFDVTVFRDA